MLMLFLFAPVLSPIGLAIAAWAYPWRTPSLRPYIWFVLALGLPLLALFALQALFGLPAGSCVERPLNVAPSILALASVALGVGLAVRFKTHRRFVVGVALAICPLTIFWSIVAAMSLAGCWI
ncbi:hypothetical protein CSW64_01875 [Caulobacter mirabilis]|uniref:Uncharacterized protein n=2 Tax=Caulobacter mirabilis TaxID=69666 RepID=A0A2D2ATF2_9CAUL|nr:hypothetical protein CSW64_01875 [Caulobacter mirabilis]